MEKLEEGIGDSVRPKNKFESQGESIQDSCKTSNDVRCRDLGSEESTREQVGYGGNEDVFKRWMSGVTKLDRIRNERIRGTTKVEEISKKVQESRLKWYGIVLRREDEYVGKRVMAMEVPGEKKERKTKAEVVGYHQERLVGERIGRGRTRKIGLNGGVS